MALQAKVIGKCLCWLVLLALCAGTLGADARVDKQVRIMRILANQEMCKHAKN